MPDLYQSSVVSSPSSGGIKSDILPEVLLLWRHDNRSQRRALSNRNRVPAMNWEMARLENGALEIRL
jgi:hypothetical protein